MKLLVLNMSRTLKQDDLVHLFGQYGKVSSATIVMDKEKNISKGFGFVDMDNDIEAKAAIEALHNKKVKGHRLRVKEATGEKAPTPPKFSHAKTAAKRAEANLTNETDE